MYSQNLGPRARPVYETLRAHIVRSELAAGTKLPPHTELAAQFGVAPLTMRQVLGHLQQEGLVSCEQGRGTFIAPQCGNGAEAGGADMVAMDDMGQALLFAHNPHPMWIYDLETLGFLAVNEAALSHYGYSRDQLLAMRITDIGPPDGVPRLLGSVSRLRTGLSESGTWRHRAKDGRIIDVEISSHATRFASRPAVLVLAQDVTARKRAEDALRAGEERLSRILETNADGILIVDSDGRFTFANAAVEKMVGLPRSDIIGRNNEELGWQVRALGGRPVPGGNQGAAPADGETASPSGPDGEPAYGVEVEIEHRDGRRLVLSANSAPLQDAEGATIGRVVSVTDITDRKRTEEALRIEAQRLAAVVATQQEIARETAVDAIAQRVVDRMQEITGAEGAALGFIEGDDLVYRAQTGLVPPGFRVPWHDGLTGICLRSADAMLVPDLLADPRMREGPVAALGARSAILVPLFDEDRPVGLLFADSARPGAFTDRDLQTLQLLAGQVAAVMSRAAAFEAQRRLLAERAERNDMLEQEVARRTAQLQTSNKELEAFAYSVSHDLRAPLRGIDGFSKVLLDRYADALDETGRGYLGRVRAASQKMSLLIDDLLQISRVTRQEMRLTQVDLTALAASIAADLHENDPGRPVDWVIAEGLTARGDDALLRVALGNLVGNAWKFTAKHPTACIEVGATSDDGGTVYYVRDDGAGFDMRYAGKMFGAFQRLHSTGEFEGTGIGLATVQRIIHRHGGWIEAEGVPGQGATFRFTLEPASS